MTFVGKTVLLTAIVISIASGCQNKQSQQATDATSSESHPEAQQDDAKATAMAAKEALFARLSGRLMEVMQADGPAAAIEVCSREASDIAKAIGEEHDVKIGRTASKLRNAKNEPPEWVQPLIEQPSSEPQFVDLPDGHTGALLPIKLQAKCLACHGPADSIADDVKLQLAKLYPQDQATGFKEGDLRGWFWVDVPQSPSMPR